MYKPPIAQIPKKYFSTDHSHLRTYIKRVWNKQINETRNPNSLNKSHFICFCRIIHPTNPSKAQFSLNIGDKTNRKTYRKKKQTNRPNREQIEQYSNPSPDRVMLQKERKKLKTHHLCTSIRPVPSSRVKLTSVTFSNLFTTSPTNVIW